MSFQPYSPATHSGEKKTFFSHTLGIFFSFFLSLDPKTKRRKLLKLCCRQLFPGTGPKRGPKIKLKTEIERNENSIEFLTLIFFSSLRSRASDQTICLSRADDGNWVGGEAKFYHIKNEWNWRSWKDFSPRMSRREPALTGKLHAFCLFTFSY